MFIIDLLLKEWLQDKNIPGDGYLINYNIETKEEEKIYFHKPPIDIKSLKYNPDVTVWGNMLLLDKKPIAEFDSQNVIHFLVEKL